MSRKPIPKKLREQVYAKYNGHCAYCGCELEYKDMQVDHIDPVYWVDIGIHKPNETIDNYMPSCRACNFYKSVFSIEQFRSNLQETLMRNVRRPFDYRLAVKYGLVVENVQPIKFYFEKKQNRFKKMNSEAFNRLKKRLFGTKSDYNGWINDYRWESKDNLLVWVYLYELQHFLEQFGYVLDGTNHKELMWVGDSVCIPFFNEWLSDLTEEQLEELFPIRDYETEQKC